MDKEVQEKITLWQSDFFDQETRDAIRELVANNKETELLDAFYKDLSFGTGGLRGIMGPGPNRMNKYTVGMATQGFCNYLLDSFPQQNVHVAIAYDSRLNSRFFAQIAADVFTANGIGVYLFDDLRPTPELSFAIRYLQCKGGLVVTASHNPKEYNGYKAYWEDGAQLTTPHDKNVMAVCEKLRFEDIKFEGRKDLIKEIGAELDEAYWNQLKKLISAPEEIKKHAALKMVYSSIHGSGIKLVPKALANMGFENVHIVEEQQVPDGSFSTVVYPNPEEKEALTLALKLADRIDAELVMANDPDADRVGIAIRNLSGDLQLLNGNQTAVLLFYYLLYQWKQKGKLEGHEYVVKTIVTTNLISSIAQFFEVTCFETLTGFKHIASLIRKFEGEKTFIIGGEESYGYLIGDFLRDKDGVASCMMIAEMTAYAKEHHGSLYQMLLYIYKKFGFYKESLLSLTKKGREGEIFIRNMMQGFRENPPISIAGFAVVEVIDYHRLLKVDVRSGRQKPFDFTASDVLQFVLEEGSLISVRPSGTEPKIKFYFSVNEKVGDRTMLVVNDILDNKIQAFEKYFKNLF